MNKKYDRKWTEDQFEKFGFVSCFYSANLVKKLKTSFVKKWYRDFNVSKKDFSIL